MTKSSATGGLASQNRAAPSISNPSRYKTERGGTLLETRGGGRREILGGFSYTTTAGRLAPMFVTDNASVFTFFSEVCYNGDPFETLIRETRQKTTKVVKRGQGTITPYVAIPASK